jgi:hypothetical protein
MMKSNSTSLDSRINLNKSSDTKKIAILPELATIHLGALQDALERSLTNNYIVFPMIEKIWNLTVTLVALLWQKI